jgi:ribosome assembly protein 1
LIFSHWAAIDQDPFFEPTTEEEIEEWGDNIASIGNNLALTILNDIRRRKV